MFPTIPNQDMLFVDNTHFARLVSLLERAGAFFLPALHLPTDVLSGTGDTTEDVPLDAVQPHARDVLGSRHEIMVQAAVCQVIGVDGVANTDGWVDVDAARRGAHHGHHVRVDQAAFAGFEVFGRQTIRQGAEAESFIERGRVQSNHAVPA